MRREKKEIEIGRKNTGRRSIRGKVNINNSSRAIRTASNKKKLQIREITGYGKDLGNLSLNITPGALIPIQSLIPRVLQII